jgi:alkylated DNA repair dioxygenase AlkB
MLLLVGVEFDYCLVNLYRNGQDYINFHADNETKDTIASITLGATRRHVFSRFLPFPSVS